MAPIERSVTVTTGRCPPDPEPDLVAAWLALHPSGTAACYRSDLVQLRAWCAAQGLALTGLQPADLRRWARHLQDERGLAPATVARRLVAASGLFKHLLATGIVEYDPTLGVRRPRVPQSTRQRLVLAPADLPELLAAADRHSPRAAALVSLGLLSGLRISSMLGADVTDLHPLPGRVLLEVRLKGGDLACVPLAEHTRQRVAAYTAERTAGPLFLSRRGLRWQRPAAAVALRQVAQSCLPAERAVRVSPHSLRHCFALSAASLGVSPFSLARALGHRSLDHVMIYVALAGDLAGADVTGLVERALLERPPGGTGPGDT